VLSVGAPFTGGPGGAKAVLWLSRSHINTKESSAPDARVPRLDGDHSMQLIAPS